MTDMTTKWLNSVAYAKKNFWAKQVWHENANAEFTLYMANFLGIWNNWHADGNGWIYATHDKLFKNEIYLTWRRGDWHAYKTG